MNLSQQPARTVAKPSYKRNKPTARQRGEISTKVRQELRERSRGVCERCGMNRATDAAHLVRRWRIEGRTTALLLAHLCHTCHLWADGGKEGREWLERFREQLSS